VGWLILNHMVQYIKTVRRNARAGRALAPSALPPLLLGANGRGERRSERSVCAFSALVKKQDRSGTKNGLIAINFRIVGNSETELIAVVGVTCMVRRRTARRIGFDENSLRKCIRPLSGECSPGA
jgi:hypothetical protein